MWVPHETPAPMPRRLVSSFALTAATLALALATAALLPSSADAKVRPCVDKIIADWDKNKPVLRGRYPVTCYREAIREANQDLKDYTDFVEDVERARTREIRRLGIPDPGDPGETTGTDTTATDTTSTDTTATDSTDTDPTGPGDSTDPSSVPVPLIVLGGLSGLLLALGGAGYLRRRSARGEEPWAQDEDDIDAAADDALDGDGDGSEPKS